MMVPARRDCWLENLTGFVVGNFGSVEELPNRRVVFGDYEARFERGWEVHVSYHPSVESSCLSVGEWNFQYRFGLLLYQIDGVVRFVESGAVLEGVREIEAEIGAVFCGRAEASLGKGAAVDAEWYLFFGFRYAVEVIGD